MDQASIRKLMNQAAIDAVKMMTSNQVMKETHFFMIEDIPKCIKLSDVMTHLQKTCKLNFVTYIQNSLESHNMRSILIACRNTTEFESFKRNHGRLNIKGFILKIEESTRPLSINHVKFSEEMDQDVKELSRVISFKASHGYSKVFPSERMLEILLEMRAEEWMMHGIEGIWLKYSHHKRELEDSMSLFMSNIVSFRQASSVLKEYGNRNIEKRSTRTVVTFRNLWKREEIIEMSEMEEPVYKLTRELLSKDMITRNYNFNNIRSMLN